MKKRINSCRKGKVIERKACEYLASIGFPGCVRAARNGVDNAADLDFTDCPELAGWHIECKGDQRIDLGTKALDDALHQAWLRANKKSWAVLWKRNRTGWRLTIEHGGDVRTTFDTDDGIAKTLRGLSNGKEST